MSFNDINVELDRGATTRLSMNDVFFRELFERTSGSISLSGGYGKSNGMGLHTGIVLERGFGSPSGIGRSVAVHENIMATSYLDAGMSRTERVHVFNTDTGAQLYELTIPSAYDAANTQEAFGVRMVMNSNYLVISAFNATVGEDTLCGVAFVYSTPTGQLLHTLLNPNPDAGYFYAFGRRIYQRDQFGLQVGLSGTNIVIGAPNEDFTGEDARYGVVYCYDAVTGDRVRTLRDRGVQNLFGKEVDIDGDNIVVGGNNGIAELFSFSTGALLHTFTDTTESLDYGAGNGVADLAGVMSISGGIVAIANSEPLRMVSLFSTSTGNHLRTIHSQYRPTLYERNGFGKSVALDGENLLISSYKANNPPTDTPNSIGMCQSYNATTGALVLTIQNPTPNIGDNFGSTMAISDDQVVIATRNNGGYVHQYRLTN